MGWLAEADGATPLEQVLGLRPELLAGYRRFYRTLWRTGKVPRRMLELTRLRIAAIHDCEAEWAVQDAHAAVDAADLEALRRGDVSRFSAAEQAALAVAERMPYAHHQIDDSEVEELASRLGAPGTVGLLTALAFFDVACRMKLVLDVPARSHRLDEPPLWRDSLV